MDRETSGVLTNTTRKYPVNDSYAATATKTDVNVTWRMLWQYEIVRKFYNLILRSKMQEIKVLQEVYENTVASINKVLTTISIVEE